MTRSYLIAGAEHMKLLLLSTQVLAGCLLAVPFPGCDEKRPKATAKRPPPVVTVGEGDGYEQNQDLRLIPVGAQLTITPAEETTNAEQGADGWRVRIGAPMQDDGSGVVTRLEQPLSFKMPDTIIRIEQREYDRYGQMASGRTYMMLVPMAFMKDQAFDEWSLIVDRRIAQRTNISFRGLSKPDFGLDFKRLFFTLHYLDRIVDHPLHAHAFDKRQTTASPWLSPASADAPAQTVKSEIRDIGDRKEVTCTLRVQESHYGPISVIQLQGYPSRREVEASNNGDDSTPTPDWIDDAVGLQVPITNYTDPILLFTKDNPNGVPITPEELKELLPAAATDQPAALAPVTKDASP